jgi:ribosomal protein L20A (L18A)
MKFLVSGMIKIGSRKFKKEIEAASERRARELAYTLLGAQQGLSRTQIAIDSVSKVV